VVSADAICAAPIAPRQRQTRMVTPLVVRPQMGYFQTCL
jgi:hypothetical protein